MPIVFLASIRPTYPTYSPFHSTTINSSGKIMRRILRKIAAGETDSLGDTSTLADPSVVGELIANHCFLGSGKKEG